jgi:hypothetical protein
MLHEEYLWRVSLETVQIVPIAKQKEWAKQRKKVFKMKRVEVNDVLLRCMYWLVIIQRRFGLYLQIWVRYEEGQLPHRSGNVE